MQPPAPRFFKVYPYHANYLIIKRVPTGYDGYDGLKPREEFKLVKHFGITMRQENKKDCFYENVGKFDPKKEGTVVLVEWNPEKATKTGFLTPGKFF